MGIDTNKYHPTTHWFVPLDQLDAAGGAPLRPADLKPSADEPLANDGDAFLVTLETLLIVKKYDSKSDNDLLVRSRLKYGNEQIVEAINFFENDVPAGSVRNNLLCEYIYAQETYSKLNRVHLEVEVMELSGDISLDKNVAKGLNAVKNTFGMVLSSFLPFGGVAFNVMKKVNGVRSDKRRIFLSQLDLYGEGGEGEARLRYGAYVFFREPVDVSDYKLHQLQIKPNDPSQPCPYDYVVVKVVPTLIHVGSNEEIALQNQKLAASLATMDGQMDVNENWHPNFDSLMSDSKKLKKLALFYSLKKRQEAGEALDNSRIKQYHALAQQLKEFIE